VIKSDPSGLRDDDPFCVFERTGFEPRYRRLQYVVAPRHISLRMAFRKALDCLLPLVRSQGRRPSKLHPTGLCTVAAVAGTGKDQLALELGGQIERYNVHCRQ
jgi:hypothetical protein